VRALARDLGRAVGTGGHLSRLRRLASGHFNLDAAVPLDTLLRDPGSAEAHLIPPSAVVRHLPAVRIEGAGVERACHGAEIDVGADAAANTSDESSQFIQLVGPGGILLGIARRGERRGSLHPVVVLM
jgi:tRNA pseudouridine55 synthase